MEIVFVVVQAAFIFPEARVVEFIIGSRGIDEAMERVSSRQKLPDMCMYSNLKGLSTFYNLRGPRSVSVTLEVLPLSWSSLFFQGFPSRNVLVSSPSRMQKEPAYALEAIISSTKVNSPSATIMTSSIRPAPILFSISLILKGS